jgi:DNA invertase Pin-like site-specific DNA recombinase
LPRKARSTPSLLPRPASNGLTMCVGWPASVGRIRATSPSLDPDTHLPPLGSAVSPPRSRPHTRKGDTVRVIGYARRSRERENGAFSLDDQEHRIRAWAQYKGHDLEDVLREDDTSGALVAPDDRPKLGPVLAGLGRGDVLVVAKFDRLSRSLFDFADLLERCRREGWSLVCLDPELDLTTASGRAMAGMLAVFAQYEKEQLIERLQGAKRAKGRAGGYVGGGRLHRRYGYALVEQQDGKLEYEEVEGEQEVIAAIRRMRASDDMTLRAICDRLEADGVDGPTGRGWNPVTVRRLARG